ncbi:Response regulator receiver domain-containing protein [Palleronia salina]|uniref:Response regulator receiver domain-containing protein n=1 Tax=Palleronia salina TaxID=313368 RepID=A0A1M6LES7_9RHOB|nr:response regulator [Palleronia salina]SHJ69662.1 Response regulator receiver domain-containing protein [Palleronia salina]
MTDILDDFLYPRRPTAERPLLGQTVLVVEDSRFAGETIRLMCLRGGARIRRADSLRAAARHLSTYRPSVILVDLGLPDGSGLDLIRQLDDAVPRVPVLLALSGDPALEEAALNAGANGFISKPFGSVAGFQSKILAHLPTEAQPRRPRPLSDEVVHADAGALGDDYALILDLLDSPQGPEDLLYAINFGANLARNLEDGALDAAVTALREDVTDGRGHRGSLAHLAGLVQSRLARGAIAV